MATASWCLAMIATCTAEGSGSSGGAAPGSRFIRHSLCAVTPQVVAVGVARVVIVVVVVVVCRVSKLCTIAMPPCFWMHVLFWKSWCTLQQLCSNSAFCLRCHGCRCPGNCWGCFVFGLHILQRLPHESVCFFVHLMRKIWGPAAWHQWGTQSQARFLLASWCCSYSTTCVLQAAKYT